MGLSIRFYLFAEDGLQSISQRVMMGLIRSKDAMPQYAGTKQKVADVILESEGKRPVRIERVQGSYLTFDENDKCTRISWLRVSQRWRRAWRSKRL
ncbi:hypothetical protein [Bradyrhizobium sp. SEMIA]|uniref:hypothetical protein n=1 Tax=Bradyrhizobium sp. SEMIA TaxID=2597515 RepID=UPI0018A5C649|nr:hypothetical protein [Bradyrhizobium sp. SEMIA]QOG22980.1 hypothetical protein FOM02_42710 [Bradyrhizobium sp. SEMIA]